MARFDPRSPSVRPGRRRASMAALAPLLLLVVPMATRADESPPPPAAGSQAPTAATREVAAEAPADATGEPAGVPRTVGLGVLLGQPVGLTVKLYVAPDHALQLGLGYDLVELDAGFVTLDWVWHPILIVGSRVVEVTWHVGLGAALGIWPAGRDYDCTPVDPAQPEGPSACRSAWVRPGVRVPLGFDLRFREMPLELYAEFAPGVFAYPAVEFLAQGGFGFRWFW